MAYSEWGTKEVAKWLTTIGLEEVAPKFIENRINGSLIVKLTERMAELLVPVKGDRIVFLEELEKLKKSPQENHSPCVDETALAAASSVKDVKNSSRNNEDQQPETSGCEAGPSSSTSTDVVWHDLPDYKLPVFPPHVKVLLETRRNSMDYMPGTANRRAVLDVVTGALQKQGLMTISRKGYSSILSALFMDYSFLGDPRCWRHSLRNKMKLLRMPLNSTTFLELKKKFGTTDGSRGQKRKSEVEGVKDVDGLVKRLIPQISLVENEDVVKTHVTLLQQEMRKTTPDLQLCERKLERTFAYRQKLKYDPQVSVGDILSEFPALRHRKFLAVEANLEKVGCPGEDAWEKLHGSLIHIMKFSKQRCKNFKLHYAKYSEDLDSAVNEQQRKDIGLVFALRLIPSLFREDEEMILVDSIEAIKAPSPVLVVDREGYQLYINGDPILFKRIGQFSTSFEAYFYSYWAFGIEYPKELQKTMLFVEKYIFNLQSKIPSLVTSWGKKLGVS